MADLAPSLLRHLFRRQRVPRTLSAATRTLSTTSRRLNTRPLSFGNAFDDAAGNPVIRDALVPIVIEQTVRPMLVAGFGGNGARAESLIRDVVDRRMQGRGERSYDIY